MTPHTDTTTGTAADAPTTTGTAPRPTDTSYALARTGGIAAQLVAGTYVLGFIAMAAYFVPRGLVSTIAEPEASLAFLVENHAALAGWYLVLYLLGGAAMVLVSLGVGARLSPAPALARVSTALGLVWSGMLVASGSVALVAQQAAVELHAHDTALALDTWVATSVVQDALGGGIEVAGALWAGVVGYAALRTRVLPAGLGGLALGLAAVGAVTVVPAASEIATDVFGLGFIVWFTWLGVVLVRRSVRA